MKAVLAFSIMLFVAQFSLSDIEQRNPLFGVYRGQGTGIHSCTIAIIEYRASQMVSFLVDQNPYVLVSSTKILESLNSRATKFSLQSVERDQMDRVDLSFDAKNQRIEVTTVAGGITAKCQKAFQIRRQN